MIEEIRCLISGNQEKKVYRSSIDFNLKVESFIDWYHINMVKDYYTSTGNMLV